MKQVPEQYLAPVQEFLNYVLGNNNCSDAVITGGLIRDLVLGVKPRDTDVLIKTNMSVKEIMIAIEGIGDFTVYESYAPASHFDDNYKLLVKDNINNIDFLFIHNHLSIDKVRHSFDCSLNLGYALPHLGVIYPPNLEVFTYNMSSGSIERFEKFSSMFLDYQKKQPNMIELCKHYS